MNDKTTSPGETERKLNICVVFDEHASAFSAEVMIKHVAADYQYETKSFHFDELIQPVPGIAAARSASETDILVLAMRQDGKLPAYIRLWIGLCAGMRDEFQEGALVALLTQTERPKKTDPWLVDYLETVAIIGRLAFFLKQGRV